MMIRSLWCLLVLGMGMVGTVGAQTSGPSAGEPALRPGDHVRITVWEMPQLSGEFLVSPDGTLEHPLYRTVNVAGVPVSVAEQRIGGFLSQRDARSQFVVAPLLRVAVGGEVARPDLYYHPTNVTIAQAITLAGGVTQQGRLNSVRLIRDGTVTRLDLTDPASATVTMPIRSGDQIVVGRSGSVMRDIIGPASSVIGAISGVLILLIRAEVI